MTISPGHRLGPYEILAPIGAGGMGEVYRARDERLKRDVAIASSGGLVLYPTAGGEGRPVPGTSPDDVAIRWSRDGGSLLVCSGSDVPRRIERVALSGGKRELVRTVGPADLGGVTSVGSAFLGEDEKSYAYVFSRTISHLFLVEGGR
jgi:hypothetical protein